MRIALQVLSPMRAWHRVLIEALEQSGHEVGIEPAVSQEVQSRSAAIVLSLERRVFGKTTRHYDVADAPSRRAKDADLCIVLAGEPPVQGPWLWPLFDDVAGETGLITPLLRRRAPVVTVQDNTGRLLSAGLPAVEDRFVLARALDSVLGRLITLLVKAVATVETPAAVTLPECEPHTIASPSPIAFITRFLTRRLVQRYGPAKGRANHWRIAFRRDARGATADRAWGEGGFTPLADDGQRFYADPFLFEQDGVTHLFFEDFPYATSKGVISSVMIGADGTASTPRVVLERPVHLSYPMVFREGGYIYMLPETSGASCIQLFRADPFPNRWVPDKILVDDVIASDATLVQHEGRYWIFATITEPGGSTWDQLALFHAPSLFGPWTAHPLNPVLIDAGSARPAGAMWHENGHLMRVAQDCRSRYGAGLTICRVDRLDPESFAQTIVQRLGPPQGFDANGVHTMNRCGDLDVIDLRVPHPR